MIDVTGPPDTGHPTRSEVMATDTAAPKEMSFGSTNGPAFRTQAIPAYPALARRHGKEGVVLLRLNISKTGQLTQIEVLQDPGYGFSDAAHEAVRNSSFMPARHNGKPVAVWATLPIRFTLR
jgi:protein TonB